MKNVFPPVPMERPPGKLLSSEVLVSGKPKQGLSLFCSPMSPIYQEFTPSLHSAEDLCVSLTAQHALKQRGVLLHHTLEANMREMRALEGYVTPVPSIVRI